MKKLLYATAALTTALAQGASSSSTPPTPGASSISLSTLTMPFGTPPPESPLRQNTIESALREHDVIFSTARAVLGRSGSPYTSPVRQPSPEDPNRKLSLLLPTPFVSLDAEIISLVEAGADPNTMCEPTYPGGERFPSVWFTTELTTVARCREHGFDITRTSDRGNSFAHHLIKQWPFRPEIFAIIRYTLEQAPALINQTNLSGDSVLTLFAKHVAPRTLTQAEQASYGPLIPGTEILTYLLARGADRTHRCPYAGNAATASEIFSDRARAMLDNPILSGFLSRLSDLSRP